MTREDKRIREIGLAAVDSISFDLFESPFSAEEQEFLKYCFVTGAQWADNHPINVWHDTNEEPKIGSNIVVIDKLGQWWIIQPYDGDYNGCKLKGWRCCVHNYNDIQKWAYIDDLLPKGCDK